MKEKKLSLAFHPRSRCLHNCNGCYLKRQTKEDDVLSNEQLDNILSEIVKYYKDNEFDNASLTYMINTQKDNTLIIADLMAYIKSLDILSDYIKLSRNDIYINSSMIKYKDKLELIDKYIYDTNEKYKTNIWISDLYRLEFNNISNNIKVLSNFDINFTVTVYKNIDIEFTIDRIVAWYSFIHYITGKKPLVYLDTYDDNGNMDKEIPNIYMKIYNKLLTNFNINCELDFCISKIDINSTLHKVINVFPDGTIKNCPYLPADILDNKTLQMDFCYEKCPHNIKKHK